MTNLSLPPRPWAGATTWDRNLKVPGTPGGAVWVSEGRNIAVYIPTNSGGCKLVCKVPWFYRTNITGMAVDEERRLLFISDDTNVIYTFLILGPCKIKLRTKCKFPILPMGVYLTGLAHDKFRNLLFITSAKFSPKPTPGSTMLYVSKAGSPCQPFCKYPVKTCGTGALFGTATGLAFDDCLYSVFVTDGTQTAVLAYKYPCAFKPKGCCPAKPVFYFGLGVKDSACRPGFGLSGKTTWARFPCKVKPPVCSFIPGYAGGPPYVGNANFKLTFTKGPNPKGYKAAALLLINWGNNCKGQPIRMPCRETIFLYPVIDPMFWSTGVPLGLVGPPPCGLSATFPLPIPVLPELCCFKFCGQWVAFDFTPMMPMSWILYMSRQFSVSIGG